MNSIDIASYERCQTRPQSLKHPPGWFSGSQPAESASSGGRGFHRAVSAILPPRTHPSLLAGPHALNPLLLSHSFFAPLGHWRWASSQWHYSTDCSASSSNMQCCDVKSVPAVLHIPLLLPLNCFVLNHTGSLLFYCLPLTCPWSWLCNTFAAFCHVGSEIFGGFCDSCRQNVFKKLLDQCNVWGHSCFCQAWSRNYGCI